MKIPDEVQNFFARANVPLTLADARTHDMPLILANDAFCELTGYALDEFQGRNCRFLQGDSENITAREDIRYALQNAESSQTVLTNFRKDGQSFRNLLFLYPIKSQQNELIYFLGSQFHIREQTSEGDASDRLYELEDSLADMISTTRNLQIQARRQLSDSVRNVFVSKLTLQSIIPGDSG